MTHLDCYHLVLRHVWRTARSWRGGFTASASDGLRGAVAAVQSACPFVASDAGLGGSRGGLRQAYEAFTPEQIKTLNKHCAALHHAPVYTLEAVGGGGVRCCIAEVFN